MMLSTPPALTLSWALALRIGGVLVLLEALRQFYRLVRIRLHVRRMAREFDVPLLPHNLLLGNLLSVAKVAMEYPRDVSSALVPVILAREHPDLAGAGAFIMDAYPVNQPMLVVYHPDMLAQFTQEDPLNKADDLKHMIRPLGQDKDLLSTDGPLWKAWRSVFNPGFSFKNISALVPSMVEEAQVYREWLRAVAAKGDVVRLDEQTGNLTIDIIGRAVLGARLETLTKPNALVDALRELVPQMTYELAPLKQLNPLRPFKIWNSTRIMRNELLPHIERCIAQFDRAEGPKTVLNLAIKAYIDEGMAAKAGQSAGRAVDPGFADIVVSHLKLFLFAGMDTTATTLCWLFHLLGSHPDKLAKMRAEHDAVLGPDVEAAGRHIVATPALLNQLPYTQAAIKETLRLYVPVGGVRQGRKGYFLTNPDTGKRFPTEGFTLLSSSYASHINPRLWPEPDAFIPERWLCRDESDPLYPPKNAWRPFELGPRNCIGQELAQIELRLVLALTMREFDIQSQFAQDGPRVLGQVAYQVDTKKDATAHPKDGMPVRVTLRRPA